MIMEKVDGPDCIISKAVYLSSFLAGGSGAGAGGVLQLSEM